MNARKLTLIVILAFAIKFWVFKPYVVTSNSMNSTLKQGDYLIVNKWENSILGNNVKPKKDDVIAFHYPLEKGDIADKLVYIKRCVGVPGDTIIVRNGKLNSAEQSLQFDYIIEDPNSMINWALLNNIDVHQGGKTINNNWILSLSDKQIKSLKNIDNEFVFQKLIQDVNQFDLSTFPSDTLKKWNRDFYGPIYIPKSVIRKERKLSVIGDIACDPKNFYSPIKIYDTETTWEQPTRRICNDPILDVTAIDNLPSILPQESSKDFASQLLPSLLSLDNIEAGVWKKAKLLFDQKKPN